MGGLWEETGGRAAGSPAAVPVQRQLAIPQASHPTICAGDHLIDLAFPRRQFEASRRFETLVASQSEIERLSQQAIARQVRQRSLQSGLIEYD